MEFWLWMPQLFACTRARIKTQINRGLSPIIPIVPYYSYYSDGIGQVFTEVAGQTFGTVVDIADRLFEQSV